MKKFKTIKLKKLIPALVMLTVFLCVAVLLSMPDAITEGARKGLSVCSGILIPSLFPFLILSGFIGSGELAMRIGRVVAPFSKVFFALSGEGGIVLLMSIIGGYPVGARMTAALLSNGAIKREEAQRLLCFSMNSGPAFAVTAVGSIMLGSSEAGLLIFSATTFSMLLLGFLCGIGEPRQKIIKKRTAANSEGSFALSFTSSVAEAAAAMLSICSWMILFACVLSAAQELIGNQNVLRVFSLFAEVTLGAGNAAKEGNIPLLCAVLGFGGFCVHAQVLPQLQSAGMKYKKFFFYRAVNSCLSFFISKLLLVFFPVNIAVSASTDTYIYEAFSVSAPAAAALLFMCAVLICTFSKPEKSLKNKKMNA